MHLVRNLGRALTAVIAGSVMLLLFSVMTAPEPKQAEAQQACYYVNQMMPDGTVRSVKICPNQVRAYPMRRSAIQFVQPMAQPVYQPVILPVNPVQPPELQDSQVIEKIDDVVKPQAEVKKDIELPKDGQPPQAAAPSGGSSGSVKASGGSTGTVKASGGSTGTVKASGGSTGSVKAASGGSNGSYGAYGATAVPMTYSSASYGSTGSQATYGYSYAPTYSYSAPYVATSFAGAAACGCPDCTCEDCNCSSMSSAYTYGAAPVAYSAAELGPVYGVRQRGFAGFFAGIRNFSTRIRGCR